LELRYYWTGNKIQPLLDCPHPPVTAIQQRQGQKLRQVQVSLNSSIDPTFQCS